MTNSHELRTLQAVAAKNVSTTGELEAILRPATLAMEVTNRTEKERERENRKERNQKETNIYIYISI